MSALVFALAAASYPVTTAAADAPPAQYIDRGACPFECCVYRTWTTEADTVVYATPGVNAKVVGRLRTGATVQAITGEVHASPVRFVVTRPHAGHAPGDTLWVYSYLGEGRFKVWRDGAMQEEDLGFSPHGGSPGTRCQDGAQCWGELERELRVRWWVKLRGDDGREGWSDQPEHFGNKDACASSASDQPPRTWVTGDFDGDGRLGQEAGVSVWRTGAFRCFVSGD